MQTSTRFTLAHVGLATATAAGLFALTACSGGAPSKTYGNLDDVKYIRSVRAVPAKTHTVTKHEKKTKTVCIGTGYKKSCSTKSDGYRTVRTTVTDKPGKPGKSAVYCVELDNVGGDSHNDDQWFEVSSSTYYRWASKPEGTTVKNLAYYSAVTRCSH